MTTALNPAIDAFVRNLGAEKIWCEVLIRTEGAKFTLRHANDREVPLMELRPIAIPEARKLAMFTAAGQFRPLHASPDLPRGWLLVCNDAVELWRALQELYPGSVPDWFATLNSASPTHYREFTNRQTGMYRTSQLLSDEQAANVIRAGCHPRFCLKRRLWTVEGLQPDSPATKSEIPCLEPCAVLLELARKGARIEQEEKLAVQLSKSELESFIAAAEGAITNKAATDRVGNIGAAANPRRLQLLLEKFKQVASTGSKPQSED